MHYLILKESLRTLEGKLVNLEVIVKKISGYYWTRNGTWAQPTLILRPWGFLKLNSRWPQAKFENTLGSLSQLQLEFKTNYM